MSDCFPRKILLAKVFIYEISHSKLFQGEYLLPGGSTYLLVNKYWGSSYFPVNNYSGVIFFRGVFINGYTGVSIVDFEQVMPAGSYSESTKIQFFQETEVN